MTIIFSEEADSDLLHIHTYLAARNRAAAVTLANLFNTKIENLTYFPFIGRNEPFSDVEFEVLWPRVMSSSIAWSGSAF